MQNRLTLFDVRLNRDFRLQYSFAKCLYFSFTEDKHIAELKDKIDYHEFPYEKVPPDRQGINRGELDRLVDSLVYFERSGDHVDNTDKNKNVHNPHIITFGSFEDKYFRSDPQEKFYDYSIPLPSKPIDNFVNLFKDFRLDGKKILWRILIVQAILYHAIKTYRGEEKYRKTSIGYRLLKRIVNKEVVKSDGIEYIILKSKCKVKKDFHDKLDNKISNKKSIVDLDDHFEAASEYLIGWLKEYSVMSPSTGMQYNDNK